MPSGLTLGRVHNEDGFFAFEGNRGVFDGGMHSVGESVWIGRRVVFCVFWAVVKILYEHKQRGGRIRSVWKTVTD